jgi:hypothetical protein
MVRHCGSKSDPMFSAQMSIVNAPNVDGVDLTGYCAFAANADPRDVLGSGCHSVTCHADGSANEYMASAFCIPHHVWALLPSA